MLSVTAMLTVQTQLETTIAAVGLDMREMGLHVQVNIVGEIHSGTNEIVY